MVEIRPALPKDIPLLREISIQTQIDTFAKDNTPENMAAYVRDAYEPLKFEREFYEPDSIYYIAWEGEEAAGFLRLRVTDEAEAHLGKSALELQRVYVSRKFQGRRIGLMLMEKAIGYGRERKFDWLWLGVWEKNFKAQAFYDKLGFKRFSEHVFQMGDDPQTDWLLKLDLRIQD